MFLAAVEMYWVTPPSKLLTGVLCHAKSSLGNTLIIHSCAFLIQINTLA